MMRSTGLRFRNVRMKGKYSFQYIEDAVFEDCDFDTKDAFWHAKNVVVKNSTVKGEYLAWYCENVTFENCTIIGTQPLCYCQGLRLINCKMVDCDLAFERSQVQATLTAPILSIKNPLTGSRITVPQVGRSSGTSKAPAERWRSRRGPRKRNVTALEKRGRPAAGRLFPWAFCIKGVPPSQTRGKCQGRDAV